MNAEIEAKLKRLAKMMGCKPDQQGGMMLRAMAEFCYADAAKVCREFSTVEGIAQKCAEAIEGRAR